MPHKPVSTYYLHVYDVESGLWVHTTLGSGVSPLSQEAMNLILLKDGILAFIGTRSEFGQYLSDLKADHGTDTRHCWTSLPASTIMSMLGLCPNLPMSGRPELVFYGSPLTVAVTFLLDLRRHNMLEQYSKDFRRQIERNGLYHINIDMLKAAELVSGRYLSENELDEAMSYVKDTIHA
jgi:hypothetical protein